jgi:hypothetical protein
VYAHNVWEAIHQNGHGCDYVSEQVLQNARFADGKLTYGPRTYKILMVIEVESMHPDTATAISNYVAAGGKVLFIGKQPVKAPGLKNHAAMDQQVADTINATRQKYPANALLYPAPDPNGPILSWFRGLQDRINIEPFIKIDNPCSSVSQLHYKLGETDCYFISNYSKDNPHEFNAEFDVAPGKTAWLWNPEDGTRWLYPTNGAKNKLHITLGPAASMLIVFDTNTHGKKYIINKPDNKTAVAHTNAWKLTLNHMNGTKKEIRLDALVDFKNDDRLSSFAGVAIYETNLPVKNAAKAGYLDLGKVHGVCELIINGRSLGIKWYGERIYPTTGILKKGNNQVIIKLTTTMDNYMGSLKENKDALKWIKGKKQPVYPNGLIGPIKLLG